MVAATISATVQVPPDLADDDPRAHALTAMCRNTLASLSSSSLVRVEVQFCQRPKFFDMDEAVGRSFG